MTCPRATLSSFQRKSTGERKVLAIGIDACDIDYLQEYLPELPQLQRLFSAGQLLRLQSTSEVLDATVWPTFITGKLPGDHGYYFPFQWDHKSMRYTRIKAGWLPFVPFWNSLAQEQIKVGLFDMPMVPVPICSSPEAVSYYHWHSQDEGFAYKQNDTVLGQKIVGIFGASPLKYDVPTNKTASQIDRMSKFCKMPLSREVEFQNG